MSEEGEPDGYKLMEKTWYSSSERVAITTIWAVFAKLSGPTALRIVLLQQDQLLQFPLMRTLFFSSPKFVINGIKVYIGVFCVRSDFRTLTIR